MRCRSGALLLGVAGLLLLPLAAAAVDNVTGTKGDFRVTVTGTKIEIEYDPKPPNTCTKIVFVQTCLTKIDGAAVKPSDEKAKWKFQDDDTAKDGKTTIDHVTSEADPYYNGDDAGKDHGQQGDATKAEANDDAKMSDTPSADIPAGKTMIQYCFETCAYCLDDNTFLECVTWQYKNDSTAGESVTHTTGANAKAPSKEMKEAKAAFDKNHTKGDGTKFSQEAVAAAGGKKFDVTVQLTGPGLATEIVPPGFVEPGPNLLEFRNGAMETDVTLGLDVVPAGGNVSGLSFQAGRRVLTVVAAVPNVVTGGVPVFGQPAILQLTGHDPGTGNQLDLIGAQLLQGTGELFFGPFTATLDTPALEPDTRILLAFDLGPVPIPALPGAWLAAAAALLLGASVLAIRGRARAPRGRAGA